MKKPRKHKQNRHNRNKKAKRRNKKYQPKVGIVLNAGSPKRKNPNGRITTVTPNPTFMKLCPFERNTDKWDEECTLLDFVQRSPEHAADAELLKLIDEIKETSQTMDKLAAALREAAGDQDRETFQQQFVEARDRNYSAIDQGALKVFGECGFGGAFSEEIQRYLRRTLFAGGWGNIPIRIVVTEA